MQYYLSLPSGWQKGRTYPVVIGIDSADREFDPYFKALVKARSDSPFIVAVPLLATNGGTRYKEGPGYRYSEAVWKQIDADPWKFDDDGLQALIAELRSTYGGSPKVLLTGFEAGAHPLFAFTFTHPELIAASAPVSPNYAGRNVEWQKSAAYPKIRCFFDSKDELWARFSSQWKRAEDEARAHGFTDLTEQAVPGKGHVPLAEEVMEWFRRLVR